MSTIHAPPVRCVDKVFVIQWPRYAWEWANSINARQSLDRGPRWSFGHVMEIWPLACTRRLLGLRSLHPALQGALWKRSKNDCIQITRPTRSVGVLVDNDYVYTTVLLHWWKKMQSFLHNCPAVVWSRQYLIWSSAASMCICAMCICASMCMCMCIWTLPCGNVVHPSTRENRPAAQLPCARREL